jgi:transglutaminase-like putative cysteine protease
MDRRDFLRISSVAPAGLILPSALSSAFAANAAPDKWRVFEVTTRVEVIKPAGVTRVWLPLPLTADTDYHKSLGNAWKVEDGEVTFAQDPKYGAGIVAAEWQDGVKPVLTLTSRFATRDRMVDLKGVAHASGADPKVLARFTEATDLIPTDGIVLDTAMAITKGIGADVDKARAIYDWVVDNTFRDPKTRGCGVGDIKFMLETRNLSGKCADLNALFVGLCRASGVPARDVYGVRVADSARGYKSLGKSGDITKAQHCRAEFYASGYGWVPADPADVRKVVLEEEGGKKLDDPKVKAIREYLFGAWEMNWLAYNYAHDVLLPKSARGRVGFFMYPQLETRDGRIDCLDPDNFKYQMTTKELILA